MQATTDKIALVKELQAAINKMQGLGKLRDETVKGDFAPFATAFPDGIFPVGAVHEMISYEPAEAAVTSGFISALAGKLTKSGGLCLWIGRKTKIFPAALQQFSLSANEIVFINPSRQKEALWIIEEALKCNALKVVVGEIKELSFTESRRLQLAVEHSGVSCFIHRHQPYRENAVACTTRWKVSPLPSLTYDLPGLGHSCWNVQLLKVRNGKPTSWQVSWVMETFTSLTEKTPLPLLLTERQAV